MSLTDKVESPDARAYGSWAFATGVIVLVAAYLIVVVVYALRLPLVMDEFNFATVVHQLKTQLPYRDYSPVKTVLGFYTQLPMLYVTSDPWTGLILIKIEMAVIAAIGVALAAFLLARDFRQRAVLCGLALLFAMSTFLERSAALRVDMLTALFGLLSFIFLLRGWSFFAGVLCTLSFLMSQKGAYYVLAGDAAVVVWVLVHGRKAFRDFLLFNGAMLLALFAYVAFWSCFAPPLKVWKDTFLQENHHLIAFGPAHPGIRKFWLQTFVRNPLYYSLGLASLGLLAWRCRQRSAQRTEWVLLAYGIAITALCLWHKAPWPYFFVFLILPFFVLHVYLFDHLLSNRKIRETPGMRWILLGAMLVAGIAYPLSRLPRNLKRDSGFQRHMVTLGTFVVKPGEEYVDGIGMLYMRQQAVNSLAWLDGLNKQRLRNMTSEQIGEMIAELERKPVKAVLFNYRLRDILRELPDEVLAYFMANFDPLWGRILIYAPKIIPEEQEFSIKFAGAYQVQAPHEGSIKIDDQQATSGTIVQLARGRHVNASQGPFRLRFVPQDLEQIADPRYRPSHNLFYEPYEF